jgi:hypothetical protein
MNNRDNNAATNDLGNTNEGAQPGRTGSNTVKDPSEWTTGNEPMTGAQSSYLKTLSDTAGVEFIDNLTKAEAAKKIDELQNSTKGSMQSSNAGSGGTANTVKDPAEWKTGDQEMTGAQRSYLKTLADEAGDEADENLTKAEASQKIDELQKKTGRGQ